MKKSNFMMVGLLLCGLYLWLGNIALAGEIKGLVTLPDGVSYVQKRSIWSLVALPDGVSYVQDAPVHARLEDPEEYADAVTDQAGSFTLSNLTDGIWMFSAEPPDGQSYRIYAQSHEQSAEITGADHIVTLSETLALRLRNLQGKVTLPDGKPAVNVWVSAYSEMNGGDQASAETDETGFFGMVLDKGEWEIQAKPATDDDSYADYGPSQNVTVTITDTDTAHILDKILQLKPINVYGTVVLADGTPVPYTFVHAYSEDWSSYSENVTDEEGNFRLALDSGIWMIFAERGQIESEWQTIPVTEETLPLAPLVMYEDYSCMEIYGVVVDSDGEPVPDAPVWAESEKGSFVSTAADENGEFILTNLFADTWMIFAGPPEGEDYSDYGEAEGIQQEITDDAVMLETPLMLQSKPPGEISGQVADSDDNPLEGFSLFAAKETEDGGIDFVEAVTDGNGDFTLNGLSDGSWQVIVKPPYTDDGDFDSYDYMEETVVVTDGEGSSELLFTLVSKTLISVRGRILLGGVETIPALGALICLYNYYYDEIGCKEIEDDGTFEFTGLEPDGYRVEIAPPEPPEGYTDTTHKGIENFFEITEDIEELDIVLPKKITSSISGTVMGASTGMSNVIIIAHNWETDDHKEVFTNQDGGFDIDVPPGRWEIEVVQPDADWLVPGQGYEMEVHADDDEIAPTFHLRPPIGNLTGLVTPPNGGTYAECEANISAYEIATGAYSSRCLESDGKFSLPLTRGNYELGIWLNPEQYPDYGIPKLEPIRFTEDKNMGEIRLLSRSATLSGVVKDDWGRGVPGVMIDIWQPDGGWFEAKTGSKGNYQIKLSPGVWVVEPVISEDSDFMFTGSAREVALADGSQENASFKLAKAAGIVIGTVVDENDELLTDLFAWAYARVDRDDTDPDADEIRRVSETWVENGKFRLKVPKSKLRIGLDLPPESGYAFAEEKLLPERLGTLRRSGKSLNTATAAIMEMYPYEQAVEMDQGNKRRELATRTVTIKLKANNATISGTLKNAGGETVTSVSGYVFASPIEGDGSWQGSDINTDDGTFEIQVSEGTWNLSYDLDTDAYMPTPVQPIQISVVSGGDFEKDIILTSLDTTVSGEVQAPDGNEKMSDVEVRVRFSVGKGSEEVIFEDQVFTDSEGKFTFSIPTTINDPSRGYYEYYMCIYTVINLCGGNNNYCYRESATECREQHLKRSPSSREGEEVLLKLREAKTSIEGKVFAKDGKTPVENAFVSAYSNDGQKAHGRTDISGKYSLQVARAEADYGNIWSISAAYKSREDSTYHRSPEVECDISGADEVVTATDITLKEMGKLPAVDTDEFIVEKGWSRTLSDGSVIQIPPDALPTKEREAKIVVEPQTEELPTNAGDVLVNYGYVISVREKTGDKALIKNFNKGKEVLMTFRYEDSNVTGLGIKEANIRPAYFSEASNSWQPVKGFTIDKEANKVTFRASHLSTWALVAAKAGEQPTDSTDAAPGDIDGSGGAIDLKDAILALKVCAGLSPSGIRKEADINNDTRIGVEEAVYIFRNLATPIR